MYINYQLYKLTITKPFLVLMVNFYLSQLIWVGGLGPILNLNNNSDGLLGLNHNYHQYKLINHNQLYNVIEFGILKGRWIIHDWGTLCSTFNYVVSQTMFKLCWPPNLFQVKICFNSRLFVELLGRKLPMICRLVRSHIIDWR